MNGDDLDPFVLRKSYVAILTLDYQVLLDMVHKVELGRVPLNASGFCIPMEPASQRIVDLRSFKEKLHSKLTAGSPVLTDLLQEPDAMPADRASVLIPHYLRRLDRELKEEKAPPNLPVLRA